MNRTQLEGLSLCTYNMHGFNNGASFLKQLCSNNDLIFVQEHWLQNSQLHMFNTIDDQFKFYGNSSMENRLSKGLLKGRPFGGVGVLWRKDLNAIVSTYNCDTEGRVVVTRINCANTKLLVCGLYLYCDDHSQVYVHNVINILGYIESILDKHLDYKCIILGDFNFECDSSNLGFCEFNKLAKDYGLVVCDDLDVSGCGYTYCHASLHQHSLIDHVFVSQSIRPLVRDYEIISDGANLSDHLPIQFKLLCNVSRSVKSNLKSQHKVTNFRWDKGDLSKYYLHTGMMLQKIDHALLCNGNNYNCVNTDHHNRCRNLLRRNCALSK